MLNSGFLIGRLASDPELRYSSNNLATSRVNIFCQRNYKNNNNERESDIFSLLFYRDRAEYFSKYARKGALIRVEYQLRNNNYEKEGRKVFSNDLVVKEWEILSNPQVRQNTTPAVSQDEHPLPPAQEEERFIDEIPPFTFEDTQPNLPD